MKRNRSINVLIATFLVASSGQAAASGPGSFFGYFANNSYIPENYDHTNVTFVWAGYPDRYTATNVILHELNQARAHGIKAIVEVGAIVFNDGCSYQPAAASQWAEFADTLAAAGHLVPGNPSASTISAFYPVDEPELCGLGDAGGAAHPTLAGAVSVIRNHPATYNYPIGVIASNQWPNVINGLRLFDWVGMDDYGATTAAYLSSMTAISGQLNSGQRLVLIPQAAEGGFMSTYGASHDSQPMYQRWASDPKVIGIMPFLWGHNDTYGLRSLYTLRTQYATIGRYIAKGGPTPLLLSATCSYAGGAAGGGMVLCSASASGGTGPYTYQWEGAPTGATARYFGTCTAMTRGVTVLDAAGQLVARMATAIC